MNEGVTWLGMFIIGVILVVTGFQGSFGRLLACIVAPSLVVINE